MPPPTSKKSLILLDFANEEIDPSEHTVHLEFKNFADLLGNTNKSGLDICSRLEPIYRPIGRDVG